ncbi:nickel/cobalt transporter [Insolitispirillum peregrinum]|uniref:nickel/cobalt transporter n=1 Tax=Insolitispirillum peregrinum TaxID=80876 RepID=UPI00361ECA82
MTVRLVLACATAIALAALAGLIFGPGLAHWVVGQQQYFHHILTAALYTLRDQHSWAASFTLIAISFGYGVFHALGPGHGKAVLSAYAATQESRWRRMVVLAAISALTQAVVAIALVSLAAWVMAQGMRWAMQAADRWLEPVSFAAVAVIGLIMAGRSILIWRRQAGPMASPHHHHDHDHHHHGHEHHHHEHQHSEDCGCGHQHLPDARALTASWQQGILMAITVGLRPCTGSLLVLALAYGLGLWSTGIAAAFAMAVGTGLTVAGLTTLAHGSRRLVVRLIGSGSPEASQRQAALMLVAGVVGGLGVTAFGLLLLSATLSQPVHPLF